MEQDALEKLRADVAYWESATERARQTLNVGEAILPGLKAELGKWEAGMEQEPRTQLPDTATEEPKFTGECIDQVVQALEWRPSQSSEDLEENLAKYGREYSRGAINYSLRSLQDRGKIEVDRKEGNMRFWSLTQQDEE